MMTSGPKAIDNMHSLEFACAELMGDATLDQSLEVTPDIMKIILRGQKSAYVVYHGIKVYIAGTRDTLEAMDDLSPEDRHLMALDKATMDESGKVIKK